MAEDKRHERDIPKCWEDGRHSEAYKKQIFMTDNGEFKTGDAVYWCSECGTVYLAEVYDNRIITEKNWTPKYISRQLAAHAAEAPSHTIESIIRDE